jgi:hypothetical protein
MERGMFFQIEKLAKTQVFAARFVEGSHLLAQNIVVPVQLVILAREQATRLNEGEIITQLYERRAKLYENHAQLARKPGRLAQKNNPAHHQQSDNDPISTVQTKLPCWSGGP